MADYRRSELVSGLFILSSVLIFALYAFKLLGVPIPGLEAPGVICETWVDEVQQLDAAGKVAVGGRQVGNVVDFAYAERPWTVDELAAAKARSGELAPGQALGQVRPSIKIRFRITDESLRVGANASVSIAQEGFIGAWYLLLDPGTWPEASPPAPLVKAGPPKGGFPSKPTAGLAELMPMVKPSLASLERILDKVDTALLTAENTGEIAKLLPSVRADMDAARTLITNLSDLTDKSSVDGVQQRLLNPASVLVKDLETVLADARRDLLPLLQSNLREAEETLKNSRSVMTKLESLLHEAHPNAQKLLANLREATDGLSAKLDSANGLVNEGKKLLTSTNSLMTDMRPQVAEIVRTLRNAMWEMDLAMRKIRENPAVILFGDGEVNLEADGRDDTGLRQSGRAKPYDQRDEADKRKKE
jgi:ABC-type transporter Mla subunit MlaD